MSGFSLFKSAFNRKMIAQSLVRSSRQFGSFSKLRNKNVNNICQIFNRNSDYPLIYNQKFSCNVANYSTATDRREIPKLVPSFPETNPSLFSFLYARFLTYFIMKKIDKNFVLVEFTQNSIKALKVVTRFIAQAQFTELDGLLTKECKEELEVNVKKLNYLQRKMFLLEAEEMVSGFPSSVRIYKGETEEKTIVELLFTYLFCRTISSKSQLYKYDVAFVRTYSPGVNDQWTIKGINLTSVSFY